MSSIGELSKKKFTQYYNKLEPLVRQDDSEAKISVQDAKEFMEKVDKFIKMFSTAHDNYVRKLEEDTEEDDLENVLDTQFKYFDEVESKFISVRKLWNEFEQKVTEEVAAAAAAENQKKEAENLKREAEKELPKLRLEALQAIKQFCCQGFEKVEFKSFEDLVAAKETLSLATQAEAIQAPFNASYKNLLATMTTYENAVGVAGLDWDQATSSWEVKCGSGLDEEVSKYSTALCSVISAKNEIIEAVPSSATARKQGRLKAIL